MSLQCFAVREWESSMTDILVVKKEVSKCEHEKITAASPTHKHTLNQYSCSSQISTKYLRIHAGGLFINFTLG